MFNYKLIAAAILTLLFIYLGVEIYDDICRTSPECACKNSLPGDPTCMSLEGLTQWCSQQRSNGVHLPQCKGN